MAPLSCQALPSAPMAPAPPTGFEDAKGPVKEIQNYSELEGLLPSSLGVIIDFWSPRCGPCLMLKNISPISKLQ